MRLLRLPNSFFGRIHPGHVVSALGESSGKCPIPAAKIKDTSPVQILLVQDLKDMRPKIIRCVRWLSTAVRIRALLSFHQAETST